MPKRDITFEIIRLLSQKIVSDDIKYPEGKIIQKTSCMNPEDAEMIGFLEAIKIFLPETEYKDELELINKIQAFMEKVGLSRWQKGELTHLGFRAGLKYEDVEDIGDQAIDEVAVMEDETEK
jgi:hypothetical protein